MRALFICWTRRGRRTHLTVDGERTLCGRERDHGVGLLPASGYDTVGCMRCEAARE